MYFAVSSGRVALDLRSSGSFVVQPTATAIKGKAKHPLIEVEALKRVLLVGNLFSSFFPLSLGT